MDKEQLRRKRISRALKGKKPKNLELIQSMPRTEAWKEKLRKARIGFRHTEESKRKIGLASKGRKASIKTKKKISENNARYWLGKKRPHMTGKKNWNYGKFGKNHSHYVENKISSLRKSIRNSEKYRQYKVIILKKDNYACV